MARFAIAVIQPPKTFPYNIPQCFHHTIKISNFFFADMAQIVLQVSGVQYDAQHEDVQGIQQATVLRSVSIFYLCVLYKSRT